MYRIGYRTASFGDWPLEQVFKTLGRLGYDSIELCLERQELRPTGLNAKAAREITDTAESCGLRIHSLSFHGDRMPWPERVEQQKAAVLAAPWFGVNTVVVNTPRTDAGVAEEEVFAHLTTLAEIAEGEGVLVAVEPEPELVVGNVAQMLRVMDRAGRESLGVNLDVGHIFLTEADLPQAIRALQGRVYHTHIEDIAGDVHKHLIPGEGDIDLPRVFCVLWEIGYRGVVTVDLFGPFDDPADVAGRALRATRDMLRRAMASARAKAS